MAVIKELIRKESNGTLSFVTMSLTASRSYLISDLKEIFTR